jgi:hypothetical protein
MNIYYIIISTISFAFCIYTGLRGNFVAAPLCFFLSLAFLFVANLNKIKRASASKDGFEIEARETIKKAEITIQEMHELSKLVAQTALSLVQRSSRYGGYSEGEREIIKENVLRVLSQMGVKEKEQDKLLAEWHEYTEIDYVLLILGNQVPSKWLRQEYEKWKEMRKDLRINRPAPAEIKKLLEENNALSELHSEAIKDYEYYIQHREHRRPEFWRNQEKLRKKFNL